MTTFAAAAANRFQRWSVIITIEGIGDYSGQWKFCTAAPTYADATYREWLTDWPGVLSESVDPLGGCVEAGELTFKLLDYRDALSAALRVDRAATTELADALTTSTTTFDVIDGSGITATSDVIFVGNEAMRVTGRTSNSLTVTRGWLGTDATAHADGDPVLLSPPRHAGRRVRLYLGPADGDSSADERLMGTYHLDGLALTDNCNTYSIRARSQQSYLGRLCASKPRKYRVSRVDASGVLVLDRVDSSTVPRATWSSGDWSGNSIWLRVGDEILRGSFPSTGSSVDAFFVAARAQLGSVQRDIRIGDEAVQVYVADETTGFGSFRVSPGPGPSGSRTTGTWNPSAHPCDIMLSLLTSSADADDDLELVNNGASGSGYAQSSRSALPVGVGIGVPVSLIDLEAFAEIEQRTPGYRFSGFAIGDEPVPFAKVAAEFLRVMGATITIAGGKITPVMERLPLLSEATTEMTLLVDEVAPRRYELKWEAEQDLARMLSSVVFKTRDPDGVARTTTVRAADFAALYTPPAYYAADQSSITIDAPSVRLDVDGGFLSECAFRLLMRYAKPLYRVTFETDISLYTIEVSSLVTFTHPDMPDPRTGLRGWTSVPGQITSRTLDVSPDAGGATMRWTAVVYGNTQRFARISPTGSVASVPSANVARLAANRYTATDAVGDLPATDAAGFIAGDVLMLMDRDGTAAAGTQIVQSVSSNDVTLDGNFAGVLAAGKLLTYADRASQVAAQYNAFTSFADRTAFTVGATTDAPFKYAEA